MWRDHDLGQRDRSVRAGLLVREVEGEFLVLDTGVDQIHQLNRSASLIWRMHGDGASLEEIAERLASEFEVSVDVAQQDAHEALARFRALSLIG